MLYGCALHAAGFFTSRGLRMLGWAYLLVGSGLLIGMGLMETGPEGRQCHLVMGGLFGGLQLASGVYLYFTEKRRTAP
jgi:hypothetical protein